jgi:hypothetical protein
MKKIVFEQELIDAWRPLFEAYPDLRAIPVYAWGRYYKYESAGNPFECLVDEGGFSGFKHNEISDINFQWDLLQTIDETHNIIDGEMWDGTWGDYYPDRDEVARMYSFDERFGRCLVILKMGNDLNVKVYNCGSRE